MPELSPSTINLITTYAVRIVGVVVLLFVAWLVAGWVKRLVLRSTERANIDATLGKFGGNMARYLVLVGAVLACLGAFGVETTSFAAVLGAAGLAVGLALQGSLANFAAGAMLLIFRPFKVGDVVSVAGQTGKVDEIEIFVTKMITPDNRLIVVPNGAIFGSTIENVTHFSTRRVDVSVGVDYSAEIDVTREVLTAAASIFQDANLPESQVVLASLGASSVDWVVRVWCPTPDYFAIKEKLTREIKMRLDQANIGIPFPQLDVHFDAPVTLPKAG
ncbi:MAG: mechanosensitive ion channel [Deltaproteobacteria bacterium]|jgi:small conductance mechanosensitive channel